MLTITDLTGSEECLTDIKDLTVRRKVNGEETLSLTIIPTKANKQAYNMVEEETILSFDNDEYVIKKLSERSIGNTSVKRVEAIHRFFVDLINKQQPNVHNGSMTFAGFLDFIFSGTGYTYSIIDPFDSKSFENLGNDNRLSLLKKGLERYKAEFEKVGTDIRFKKQIGNDTDFQFRYGHNIKALEKSVDTTNLATVIKGTGAEGITAYYRSPNADIFGEIDAPPVDDERFTSQETLLTEMKGVLEDTPEFSITIDFADLRAAGYPYSFPNEGDRVFVIYEPMNDLLIETRIVEVEEVFNNNFEPTKTSVTLSNYKKTFAGTLLGNVQKSLKALVNDDGIIRYNVLDEAVRIATEALRSAQTELIFENGIVARSKTDPNLLVVFNSAGLGISSDGGATFDEAITYLGVNTNLLTAGQINANNITIRGGSETAYSQIDSNGFFAKGTAFAVERNDGYMTIIDGMINQDFNIQGATPPFLVNCEILGRHFKTTYGAQSPGICQVFTFKKTARYLKFHLSMGVDTDLGNQAKAFIEQTGVPGVWLGSATATANISTGEEKWITVDLGTPDGMDFAVYLKLYTTSTDTGAYARVIRAFLTDF